MSVLVEALCLIVPRKVLDVSYPGGTEAFLQKMNIAPMPCRCACADDKLVSVSFYGDKDAMVVTEGLRALGIVALDNDRFYELALVDQANGPTMPCDWIEWQKHQEGYTSCWLAGTDPEPFHAPDQWTPEQSRNITFHDIRSEPGRCLKLAEEPNGNEVWLDFETGSIASGDPYRPDPGAAAEPSTSQEPAPPDPDAAMREDPTRDAGEGALIASVRAMLGARGYRYRQIDAQTLTLTHQNERGTYVMHFTANEATDLVGLWSTYGSKIPDARRVPIAEALSRINFRLWLGNFELDFSDGEIRFRISIDVEEGRLSEMMLSNMLGCCLHTMERYHFALMRIAFGDVKPEVALAELV